MREPSPVREHVTLTPEHDRPAAAAAMSALAFVALLLRSWMTLMIGALILGAAGFAAGIIPARTYTSVASFMPQERRQLSQLSGLAAQFGLAVPNGESGFSATVYSDLVKSDAVLGAISVARFPTSASDSAVLLDALGIPDGTQQLRRARAIRVLQGRVQASSNARTGVVTISATMTDPVVAKSVADRVITELVRFNVERRQTQASAERRFTERQLTEAKDSLAEAESRLRQFLKSNRGDVRVSPDLSLDQDRLSRRVTMEQQIYTTLAQAYEQAKIEEVRDTPVITVLQPPEVPVLPNSRRVVVKTALGLFVGLLCAVVLVLFRVTLQRRRQAGDLELVEWLTIWDGVRRALRLQKAPPPTVD
jgi:uncharacterized protein involved in exopolysaccharide biosynthesis